MTEQHTHGYWLEMNEAESQRLFIQHRYFTSALGGLLPQSLSMDHVQSVLDIGCGSGGWALDLVKQYPQVTVKGIDISEVAIHDATRYAQTNGLSAATFEQMDATQPLRFEDATFDLVHMRSASPFIRPDQWLAVLAELVRVLKRGGWLLLIDYEQGPTSSEAFNQIGTLAMKAVRAAKLSLSPASLTIGVASRLYGFMWNIGLQDVSYSVHAVDFGVSNNPDASAFVAELLVASANIKSFLVRLALIESDTFDALIERAGRELTQPDTCGYAYLISSIGRKS